MRPALEGFAGIPQEVRLLFRGLSKIDSIEVNGMLQTSHKILAKGSKDKSGWFTSHVPPSKKINRYSRVIVSMAEKPYRTVFDKVYDFLEKRLYSTALTIQTVFFGNHIKLTRFETASFEDFIWRTLFSKTLPASDFELVTKSQFRVNSVPWHTMHLVGLNTLNASSTPKYPWLDTKGVEIFIGQTPYPGNVRAGTKLVIRYHDAIPVFMPHTIPDKSMHQATHFFALMSNVKSGAWFACVSHATRKDLINLFPEVADRALVIHNMVSHHYYDDASKYDLVPGIIRGRLHEGDAAKGIDLTPSFFSLKEKENFYSKKLKANKFNYLLIVSTIEPRKNHMRLLAAWEIIKAEIDPDLKLVVVGGLGWDYAQTVRAFSSWIDQGELFALSSVPSPDLRTLYKHAAATVCPSLGEGFDFSGVESMASGGITIASDIPVHQEVYDDAAEYFDPYSTASLVKALKKVLYETESAELRQQMKHRGGLIAKRYQPEMILPQWENLLTMLSKK